jgi:hypothetical protein
MTEILPLGLGFTYTSRVICVWLSDNKEGFRILLSGQNEDRDVLVEFYPPLAYRNIDEGDFQRTLGLMKGLPRVTLYEAFDSDFLKWYETESLRVRNITDIRHFIIATENDCIEVLSETPPQVRQVDHKAEN